MFKTLSSAKAEISKLTSSITDKDAEITDLKSKLEEASKNTTPDSKVTELNNKITNLNSEVEAETTRADDAEAALEDAKGDYESIEARIDAEATAKATEQIANVGGVPLSSNKKKDGEANSEVTEDNFWSEYRSQPASSKAQWYADNKSKIGR